MLPSAVAVTGMVQLLLQILEESESEEWESEEGEVEGV